MLAPSATSAAASGLSGAVGEFEQHRRLGRGRRNASHRDAAELDQILRLAVRRLAGADHDQPGRLQSGRRHDVERAAALAGEALGLGGPRDQVGGGPQHRAGPRPEPQLVVGENDQHTPGGRRDRAKAEFPGIRHWN